MKAVVDNNISSPASQIRRLAFDNSTDLMSQSGVSVLLEGRLYAKIKTKLNLDQQKFFENIYRIDESAKDVNDYDIIKAIKWVAQSESNSKKVVILSENLTDYQNICNKNIKCITPASFLDLVGQAQKLYSMKIFSTLDDALMAILFIIS